MWVYEIRNVVSGKVYIGQTIQLTTKPRWYNHRRDLTNGTHINKYLQNDWNIFGPDVFKFNTIKKCTSVKELDNVESRLIAENKQLNIAYNISEGGQSSRVVYYKRWNGVKSPTGIIYENIENMEKFARTHKLNSDMLRRVSKGVRYSYKGWTTLTRDKKFGYRTPIGSKMSIESNRRRSVSLKTAYKEGRKVAGEKLKKVYNGLVSPEGKVFNNVVGLAEFCRQNGLPSTGSMSEVCSGKRKQYKGWTYNPSVTSEK